MANRMPQDGLGNPYGRAFSAMPGQSGQPMQPTHPIQPMQVMPVKQPYPMPTIMVPDWNLDAGAYPGVPVNVPPPMNPADPMLVYGAPMELTTRSLLPPPIYGKVDSLSRLRQKNILKMFNVVPDVKEPPQQRRRKYKKRDQAKDQFASEASAAFPLLSEILLGSKEAPVGQRRRGSVTRNRASQPRAKAPSGPQLPGMATAKDPVQRRRGGRTSGQSRKPGSTAMMPGSMMKKVMKYPSMQQPLNIFGDINPRRPIMTPNAFPPLQAPQQWMPGPVVQSMPSVMPPTPSMLPMRAPGPSQFQPVNIVQVSVGMKKVAPPMPIELMADPHLQPMQQMQSIQPMQQIQPIQPIQPMQPITIPVPGMPPMNNTIIMEPLPPPMGIPLQKPPEALYVQDPQLQQISGSPVELHPQMKAGAPGIPYQLSEEGNATIPVVVNPIIEPQPSISLKISLPYPMIVGVANSQTFTVLDKGGMLPPAVIPPQVPVGVSLGHVIPDIPTMQGPMPVQPTPTIPPRMPQDIGMAFPPELKMQPIMQPTPIQIPAPPMGMAIADAATVVPELASLQLGAPIPITTRITSAELPPMDQPVMEPPSLMQEIMKEKDAFSNIPRDKFSAARRIIESFQNVLESRRRRMRAFLEEDCRNVLGEYSKIDVTYPTTLIHGKKYFFIKDVTTGLLPFHMFYYEKLRPKQQDEESKERKRDEILSKLEYEIEELRKKVGILKIKANVSQENYECTKSCLDAIARLSLRKQGNDAKAPSATT